MSLALLTWLVGRRSAAFSVGRGPTTKPTPDEAREHAVAERFRKVLETNPRRGTALDRLYGYHVERGTLDQLVAELRRPHEEGPQGRHRLDDRGPARKPARPGRRRRRRLPAGRGERCRRTPCRPTTSASRWCWSASRTPPPRRSSGPSPASRPAPTCSTSSRPWAASTSAPSAPTRPSPSGTGWRSCSPTTPGAGADRHHAGRGGAVRPGAAAAREARRPDRGQVPANRRCAWTPPSSR